jgi:uncharacterized membrane protein YoaK (UPF0700 family)
MKNIKISSPGTSISFFQRPIFWLLHLIIFLASAAFSIHFYPKAFPIVDINITMDRTQALDAAQKLALTHHWEPVLHSTAASFESDGQAQTFIELAGGGKKKLIELIQKKFFSPYTWTVRHFKEGEIRENYISFTPSGEFYGFRQILPETLAGAALTPEQALKIAETSSKQTWKVQLSDFQLVEKSSTTQPSKRVDHSFVYERRDQSLGDGKLRLSLSVAGDQLIGIRYFVDIPSAFSHRYGEMRSANDTIASIASGAMLVLYLFGGCFFGIFYLARKKWLLWKAPLIAAAGIALLQGFERINQLPLSWMQYDTAIPQTAFILKTALIAVLTTGGEFLLLSISFMAAESLSRLAFPKHPQLWQIWRRQNASTPDIFGRTLGGYLAVGFFFAYVVAIYYLGSNYLGWWSPSDVLFQPDTLASYLPWFTSIAQSLHAGFWEESLFRAVPLASAVLIGKHFGNRKSWLTLGFIVQALIFAAAHANYPAQPSYARVIELILPSLFFGGIYVYFGLLPGIILHFTFDVISFAIPLFLSTSPRIWLDQGMVVILTLIPLFVVLWGRIQAGRWKALSPQALNQAWKPQLTLVKAPSHAESTNASDLSSRGTKTLQVLGIGGLALWLLVFPFKSDTWDLNLKRQDAIQIAKKYWQEHTKEGLGPEWEPQATLWSAVQQPEEFIWETSGPETLHRLIGSYLSPPVWIVRFVRFHVEVAERAEFYQITVAKDGQILQARHEIPDGRKGARLLEAEARTLALRAMANHYPLAPQTMKEVSSSAIKQLHRMDWLFTFSHPEVSLKTGEARSVVSISGDEVSSTSRFIFVPEDWIRQDRNQKTFLRILNSTCLCVLILLSITALIYSVIAWTQKRFDFPLFSKTLGILLALGFLLFLNHLPASVAHFSTIEPKSHQILNLILFGLIKIVAGAFVPATGMGYLGFAFRPQMQRLTSRLQQAPLVQELSAGLCIGIIVRVVLGATEFALPKQTPTTPHFSALTGYFPQIDGLESFEQFFFVGLLLLFIYHSTHHLTRGWSVRKPLGSLILFGISFVLIGSQTRHLSHWLLCSSLTACMLMICFQVWFNNRPRLIPVTVGAFMVLSVLRQMRMCPYPEINSVGAVSILAIGLSAWFWYQSLNGNSKGSSDRSQVHSI